MTSLSSSSTGSASRNTHLAACSVSLQLRAEQSASGPHRQLSCAGVLVVCSNRAPDSQAQACWMWEQAGGSTAALLLDVDCWSPATQQAAVRHRQAGCGPGRRQHSSAPVGGALLTCRCGGASTEAQASWCAKQLHSAFKHESPLAKHLHLLEHHPGTAHE